MFIIFCNICVLTKKLSPWNRTSITTGSEMYFCQKSLPRSGFEPITSGASAVDTGHRWDHGCRQFKYLCAGMIKITWLPDFYPGSPQITSPQFNNLKLLSLGRGLLWALLNLLIYTPVTNLSVSVWYQTHTLNILFWNQIKNTLWIMDT